MEGNNLTSTLNYTNMQFSSDFTNCIKWRMLEENFIHLSDQTLVHKLTNFSYPLGEYLVSNGGSVYVCIPISLQPHLYVLDYVGVFVRSLSFFALLLSALVDTWVVREIHGKTVYPIVGHKISLMVFYACSSLCCILYCGYNSFFADTITSFCFYSVRVSYCWINVVCLDMWRTFHPKKILRRPSTLSLGGTIVLPRFVLQNLYSWGIPALLIGIALLLGYLPLPVLHAWRFAGPLYGNIAQVIFMTSSVSVIVMVNVIFCGLIIYRLHRYRQLSNYNMLHVAKQNEMMHVYVKLVVMSGLLYFIQLSQYVASHYGRFTPLWLLPDWLANAQGFWLFLIYSCNQSVRSATLKKIQISFKTFEKDLKTNSSSK